MNPNSAYSQIEIVVGTDYTPVAQYIDFTDPNSGTVASPSKLVPNGLNPPIYAMLCTVSNTGTAQVQLLGDVTPISYPAGSFVKGVVYYMYLKQLVADGGGSFIGFLYNAHPFIM